jgi:ParB family transcriptional regulator, chromosome partitioning protein
MNKALTKPKPALTLDKLSSVAQIAVQKPVQPADAEIDISLLFSVKQVRRSFRNLDDLAESFKRNGIIEPLVVHEEIDAATGVVRYRIIVGERRFRAAPLAGLSKVPVIIKKGLTELQIRRLQVTENNDREDLTAYEEALGVIEDVEQYGTQEAMLIWNRGESWISKRMAVKRYADPVRELLETDRCGDFEVLHCLNQIFNIEETRQEFYRICHSMRSGQFVTRDDVRNTLSRLKTWNQQKSAADKHGDAGGNRNRAAMPATEVKDVPGRAQIALPATELTDKRKAAVEKQDAAECLKSLRNEIFEQGKANQTHFSSMKTHMTTLGHDLESTEWVLWHGFLLMTLPMLDGIGSERAAAYLKKLQVALKNQGLLHLLEDLHLDTDGAGRNPPDMPENWRP